MEKYLSIGDAEFMFKFDFAAPGYQTFHFTVQVGLYPCTHK